MCDNRGNAKVNQPIVDNLPMTEHFDKKFQFFSILNDLKCYRSTFSSFINHLWNAKPNNQSKKSSKESTFFCKTFSFSFWPLSLSNLITFLFLIHFNNLKWYKSATWSSTNHVWTLIATPCTLGVITFSFLIHFQ